MALPVGEVGELKIDRQGRVVIPRALRDLLGPIPGTVRVSVVDGGLLVQPTPTGHVETADDGLPVLDLGRAVTNDEVLAAIDADRGAR